VSPAEEAAGEASPERLSNLPSVHSWNEARLELYCMSSCLCIPSCCLAAGTDFKTRTLSFARVVCTQGSAHHHGSFSLPTEMGWGSPSFHSSHCHHNKLLAVKDQGTTFCRGLQTSPNGRCHSYNCRPLATVCSSQDNL
jgi:hypothetical protein